MRSLPKLSLLTLLVAACVGDELPVDETETPLRTLNSLGAEETTRNALLLDPPVRAAMVANPLVGATYSLAGPIPFALHDVNAQEVFERIVGCALPSNQKVAYHDPFTNQGHTWHGSLGLCPAWGSGPANLACRQVVSACVLARGNAFEKEVDISLRGHTATGKALTVDFLEQGDFTVEEGSFFGNIFTGVNPLLFRSVLPNGTLVEGPLPTGSTPVFLNMWACADPFFPDEIGYMRDRLCALATPFSELCAAQAVGSCATACALSDGPPVFGDGDNQACSGNGAVNNNVLTTFLVDSCDIVDDPELCEPPAH